MADRVGQQLGNYRLIQLLGSGGFAEVYSAEHRQLGMKAAIKILHADLVNEEISSFRQEARTIADLKHPHIIRVLDFDVQNGTPFLVLDYASKGSLRQIHPRRSRLPLDVVVNYVKQIASALQYAHEHKLIHRDVKPENILVGEDGQLLLSDFGIAAIAHSTSSMMTAATTGTLVYMSPEQIQGKPRPASDQYALAVTVYQWLTGSLPFAGSSAEIIAQHLGAPPPPLRKHVPDLPVEVEQVVLTALAKDPQLRFGSVQAFAHALALASRLAEAVPQPSLVPPVQSTQPASDAATQQASSVAVASGSEPSKTPPAQPVLTPAWSLSLTPPVQPQRFAPTVVPQRWIKVVVISGLVLILVIGSVLWFTGTWRSGTPKLLSASSTFSALGGDVQHVGMVLPEDTSGGGDTGSPSCPTPTIESLQIVGGNIHIQVSWQGLENSYEYSLTAEASSSSDLSQRERSYLPTSGSMYLVVVATTPQAGQELYLSLYLLVDNSSGSYVKPCNYDSLVLRFRA